MLRLIDGINSSKLFLRKLWFAIALLACRGTAMAQDSTVIRNEVWPEFDLFYKINNDLRIYALKSATRLRNSDYTDGGYGLFLDYFALPWLNPLALRPLHDSTPAKYVWLRVGYTYSSTVPHAENPTSENALVTELNIRFYLPFHALLTERNRIDWRSVNNDYQPRYRPRFRLEKDMSTAYLTFTGYVYGEYYFNFQDRDADKYRLCAGVEFKATKILNFEVYEIRQFEKTQKVELYATGVALKVYLTHGLVKKALRKKAKLVTDKIIPD